MRRRGEISVSDMSLTIRVVKVYCCVLLSNDQSNDKSTWGMFIIHATITQSIFWRVLKLNGVHTGRVSGGWLVSCRLHHR